MSQIIIIALIIWGFANAHLASIIFIVFAAVMELWVFITYKTFKLSSHKKLTTDEVAIFNKYNFFLRYPFTSKKISALFSGIMLSAFIWVPLLIWKGEYIQATVIGLNYFVGAPLSVITNPYHFLSKAASKGDLEAEHEMKILDKIVEIFYGYKPNSKEESPA